MEEGAEREQPVGRLRVLRLKERPLQERREAARQRVRRLPALMAREAARLSTMDERLLLLTRLGHERPERTTFDSRAMAEEALRSFFTDGQLDRAKLNDLFETAYKAGVEEDQQYIEQYGDLKSLIKGTKLTLSEYDQKNIADWNLFRRAAFGTLTLGKDGRAVDSFYQELQEMAPELLPTMPPAAPMVFLVT